MLNTEKKVMDRLGITHWYQLNWEKFLACLDLWPEMGEEVRVKIMEAVPDYARLLSQGTASVRLMVEQKKKNLLDQQEVLDRNLLELKRLIKTREEDPGRLLAINGEVAGIYRALRGENRRKTAALARYALVMVFFIYWLSTRVGE